LDYQYWKITGDQAVFDQQWQAAMKLVDATFRDQQRINNQGLYKYSSGRPTDLGYGKPVKPTGMICSMFRPSDDATTYLYNIPDNLFAVTSLRELAEMARVIMPKDNLAADCQALAGEVDKGIHDYGIVTDPKWGKIYAFEVDGLGHVLLMDDAGYPDLVAIPYLTPSLAGDPLTLNSRHFALSPENPFYIQGTAAVGTGSPHKGKGNIWPMGILMQAVTSTDNAEIMNCLEMLKMSSVGTGFIHESFKKDDPTKYSRGWFAWVNNLFGEMIIKVLAERPELLAKPLPPWYGPQTGKP
jgi:meiotically up-regulated gene 157 (Mug157) protein